MNIKFLIKMDPEIIMGVINDDGRASKIFYDAYSNYIKDRSKCLCFQYRVLRNHLDDVIERGNYILGVTLKSWDQSKGNYFRYFEKSFLNNIYTFCHYLDAENRLKGTSFDDPFGKGTTSGEDIYGDEDIEIGHSYDRDVRKQIIGERLNNQVDPISRRVFLLRMNNKTFEDIAKELNMTEKHARYLYDKTKKILLRV